MTHKLLVMIKIKPNMQRTNVSICGIALLSLLITGCGSSSDGGGISGTGDQAAITGNSDSDPGSTNGDTGDGSTGGNTDATTTGGTDTGDDTGNVDTGNGDTGTNNTNSGTDTGTTNPDADNSDTNTGNTGTDSNTTSTGTTNTGNSVSGGAAGLLTTATPQFSWTAVDGADAYQLVITEAEGNEITYNASTSVCAGTNCSTTPKAAFHNNSINWRVDALSGNNVLQSPASGSYSTPRSFELTPETSNPSVCTIWPSVSYDDIIVLNNIWNAGQVNSTNWTQSIGATESDTNGPIATWYYDWLGETDGDRTAVKAYPQIIYGNKLGTHVSASKERTGLPETVSGLPEFNVEFAFTETLEANVERNVALESFFHDSCNITGPCDLVDNRAYEMMIWVVNPVSNKPGTLAETGVMIDNRLWDVYIKRRTDDQVGYIAFTAQTPFTEGTLQWNRFVEYTRQYSNENSAALGIKALTPDMCMAAVEMGTELWWGKGSFTLDKFNVTRN